ISLKSETRPAKSANPYPRKALRLVTRRGWHLAYFQSLKSSADATFDALSGNDKLRKHGHPERSRGIPPRWLYGHFNGILLPRSVTMNNHLPAANFFSAIFTSSSADFPAPSRSCKSRTSLWASTCL